MDKCRADASLWENADNTTPTLNDLSVRMHEMAVCMDVDPFKSSPEHFRKYQETNRNIEEEYGRRMSHFIDRHGLRQQFMDEDANGKR